MNVRNGERIVLLITRNPSYKWKSKRGYYSGKSDRKHFDGGLAMEIAKYF